MATRTREPHTEHGQLSSADRRELPDSVYDQVKDVTDDERDVAFANIRKAAEHDDVDVAETDWRQLGKKPHTANDAH